MKDLFDVINRRRSIRKFTEKVPPVEILQELIEYAAMAPNAMNRQDWRFTIIISAEIRSDIFQTVQKKWTDLCYAPSLIHEAIDAYKRNFAHFIEAPVLIAVDVKRPPAFLDHLVKENAGKVAGSFASACMAVQNLLLAASARGLGTCVYSACNAAEMEIAKILKLSKQRELVCLVAVGYPGEEPVSPGRKDIGEILRIIE